MVSFILLSRDYCHLCADFEAQLRLFFEKNSPLSVEIQVLDIDSPENAHFLDLYDEKVPVLLWENTPICHYFFDENAVRALLENLKTH